MRFLGVIGALALTLTGCVDESSVNRNPHSGTGSASAGVAGVQEITIRTGSDYRFHPSTIVVHPGTVHLTLVNEGKRGAGAPHDWSVTDLAAAFVPLVPAGARRDVTFTAPAPGEYRFVCTIHTRQGQTGTLIVRADGAG